MEERIDEKLQKNIKKFPEFYNVFCKPDVNTVKYCSFYGDEGLCPVRCSYSIERERQGLGKDIIHGFKLGLVQKAEGEQTDEV